MKKKYEGKHLLIGIALMSALGLSACGKSQGQATLSTSSFNTAGTNFIMQGWKLASLALPGSLGPAYSTINYQVAGVNSFKLCIDSIEFEGEDGQSVSDEDGDTEVEAEDIGLVDLTTGIGQDLGRVNLPYGMKVTEIEIKARVNETLCGVPYAVHFNGVDIAGADGEVEFEWEFAQPIELSEAVSSINLNFGTIVSHLTTLALDPQALEEGIEIEVNGVKAEASAN